MKMVESEGCEFKRSVTPRLAREVIAFLNGRGGVIYVGVEDDGTVSGVDDPAAAMLAVESMVRDAIQPDATELMRCSVVYGAGLSEERHSNDEAQCVRIDVSAGGEESIIEVRLWHILERSFIRNFLQLNFIN